MSELVRSYEHRDVQSDCLNSIEDARGQGHTRGLINMATGLGKTYVAACDVKKYRQENPDARALYACHNTDILLQARQTFEEVLGPGVSYGHLFEGQSGDQADVVFASFQSLNGRDRLYQALDPREFKYVIDDEGHHAMARTHREVLQYLQPEFLLGLSATPERQDGRDIMDIFGTEIYRKTLEEALAEGLLTPVNYKILTDHLQKGGDLAEMIERIGLGELNKTLFIPRRDEEIAEILFDELSQINNPHGLVYAQSIEHAERMAGLLPDAVAIHSKLSPGHERELKTAFRYGEIPVAVVVDKYNEGVDVPTINFLAHLRSTTSFRVWLQQLGRGLRRYEGKDEVRVVDLAPSFERIQMILDLEDGVRKAIVGEPVETEPREMNSGINFEFSQEARDAVELIKTARATYERSRDRYHKPIENLPTIDTEFEFADKVRQIHLEPVDVLFLKSIWNSETGRLTTGDLQQLYQQQFRSKILQKELNEYLRGLASQGIISHVAFTGTTKKQWRITEDYSDFLAFHEYFRNEYEQALYNLHQTIASIAHKAMGDSKELPDFIDVTKVPETPTEIPQDNNDQIKILFNQELFNENKHPNDPDVVALRGNLGYFGDFEGSDVTASELAWLLKESDWDKTTPRTLSGCRVSTSIDVYNSMAIMRLTVSGSQYSKVNGHSPYLQYIERNLTAGEINSVADKLSQFGEVLYTSPGQPEQGAMHEDDDERKIYLTLRRLNYVQQNHEASVYLDDPVNPGQPIKVDHTNALDYETALIFSRFEDHPHILDRLNTQRVLVVLLILYTRKATWSTAEKRDKLLAKLNEITTRFVSEPEK